MGGMKMQKRLKELVMVCLVIVLVGGCVARKSGAVKKSSKDSGIKRFLNIAIWGSPNGRSVYKSIPAPQPGLVLPINRSPGVWAKCYLFAGRYSQDELIGPGSGAGKLAFTVPLLKRFVINPPMSRPYKRGAISTVTTQPLILSAPDDYTLLVFHQNMRNWVMKIETRRFSTSGNGLKQYYVSNGRRVYADRVIKLARVKPHQAPRRFKFHRTYYPGHIIKDSLGLGF